MILVTSARLPFRSRPISRAFIPMMVIMQAANEVLSRSVGENDRPSP